MTRQGEEKTNERYHWDRSLTGRLMQSIHREAASTAARQSLLAAMRGVFKDTLDVHRLADGQHMQVLNGLKGFAELFRWIESQPTALIIFEATGPYHRQLEQAPGVKGIPFVKVNPKQARRFAQASGTLAKTDRVPSRASKHTLSGSGLRDVGKDGRCPTTDAKADQRGKPL